MPDGGDDLERDLGLSALAGLEGGPRGEGNCAELGKITLVSKERNVTVLLLCLEEFLACWGNENGLHTGMPAMKLMLSEVSVKVGARIALAAAVV